MRSLNNRMPEQLGLARLLRNGDIRVISSRPKLRHSVLDIVLMQLISDAWFSLTGIVLSIVESIDPLITSPRLHCPAL